MGGQEVGDRAGQEEEHDVYPRRTRIHPSNCWRARRSRRHLRAPPVVRPAATCRWEPRKGDDKGADIEPYI